MAHSLEKRIARIEADAVDAPQRQRTMRLKFPEPPQAGRTVLDVIGLTKSYGGPPVFQDVTFDVGRGERLLVLGLNGAGKTSLLRVLVGVTSADAGAVTFGVGVSCGYYAQEHEGITPGRGAVDHLREQQAERTDTQVRG